MLQERISHLEQQVKAKEEELAYSLARQDQEHQREIAMTDKNRRQFSQREKLLRQSADEAEAAAEMAERRTVEQRATLRFQHFISAMLLRQQARTTKALYRIEVHRNWVQTESRSPGVATVRAAASEHREKHALMDSDSDADGSVNDRTEQASLNARLRAQVKSLKLQLARSSAENEEAEAQLRLRLERQFAEQLTASVSHEMDVALKGMHGQSSADAEYCEYLRQEYSRTSAEVDGLRTRLNQAIDFARSLLSDITCLSLCPVPLLKSAWLSICRYSLTLA